MIQKTTTPGYLKDTISNFVSNTNEQQLLEYQRQRASVKKMQALENELATIRKLLEGIRT